MKKLFLLLTSFMLLAACSSDDDSIGNDINNHNCNFCWSYYNGTFSATSDGESTTNKPMKAYISLDNKLYPSSYTFNFDEFKNWHSQTIQITGVVQNGNTLVYENRIWNAKGTTVTINGTVTFNSDFTTLTGEFTLTGGHTGTISFFATL